MTIHLTQQTVSNLNSLESLVNSEIQSDNVKKIINLRFAMATSEIKTLHDWANKNVNSRVYPLIMARADYIQDSLDTIMKRKLERGQSCIEYIVIIALIALVVYFAGSWAFGSNNPADWPSIFANALSGYGSPMGELISRIKALLSL